MQLPRLLRTPGFRLTALSASLFCLTALLVFGMIYLSATRFMERQFDKSLVVELASLEDHGATNLSSLIEQRLASPSTREFLYLHETSTAERLAGNLMPQPVLEGFQDIPPTEEQVAHSDDPNMLRALGKIQEDGSFLLVARDTDEVDDISDFMENSFAIGFALTLIVAIVSGGLVSARFLRRLDQTNCTIQEIMAGDLHRRIPVGGMKDEFAGLTVSLNSMLDRIQELMEGLQQVSNDIAHDMRTPLTRMRHRLERAQLTARSIDDFQAAIEGAQIETDGLLGMFSAMLRIAQIESGTRRAGFISVDFSALAQMIIETYTPVAEDNGHGLSSDIQPGISVCGDPQLLTQMMANLVENALCHTPSGTQVSIRLRKGEASSSITLEVADDGPGIPETERLRVFARFYRTDASRSRAGYGLGLSMASAIANLHNGNIILADNNPGLSAVVSIQDKNQKLML